jgi:hypothetical protein
VENSNPVAAHSDEEQRRQELAAKARAIFKELGFPDEKFFTNFDHEHDTELAEQKSSRVSDSLPLIR